MAKCEQAADAGGLCRRSVPWYEYRKDQYIAHMFLALLFLLGGAAGAWLGQFIGVLLDRRDAIRAVGLARALKPASHCNACRRPLRAGQTIPIFSWLHLQGRAACCGAPIPPRLLALEVIGFFVGGGLFLGLLSLQAAFGG